MNQEKKTLMQGNIGAYAFAMKKLINNRDFSDVRFFVGGRKKCGYQDNDPHTIIGELDDSAQQVTPDLKNEDAGDLIFAHQSILAAHCTVFKAMFMDPDYEGKEKIYFLPDMKPRIFLAMLEYIYSNTVWLDQSIAVDVLASALEYGLDDLRDLCVEYLVSTLDVKNACDVLQTAVTYNQNDLKEKAMGYIENNTEEVLLSKSFTYISQDALVSILKSSKLSIDEVKVIEAVRTWATVCCQQVTSHQMCEVGREAVKQLRLPLLSLEELDSLEETNMKDNFIPVNAFSQARELIKESGQGNILCILRKGTLQRDHHKTL